MQLVQVENGQIVNFNLPTTGILKNGSSVSGYHLLDEETLKNEGWLPLVEDIPVYNEATQMLQHNGYVIETDRVVSVYIVVNIPEPPIPQKSEIELMNEDILNLSEMVLDIGVKVDTLGGI